MARKNSDDNKKVMFVIEDELIAPFKIKVEDDQYGLFRENNILSMGYYTSFKSVIRRIVHLKSVDLFSGEVVTLEEYIQTYQEITKTISDKLEDILITDGN
jgi:DNA replication protein DnaD